MLYGDDDFDNEFGLVKKEKLNKKKIFIVIAILAGLFVIIFTIAHLRNNKNENYVSIEDEEVTENIEEVEVASSKQEKNLKEYTGEHVQIPVHNMETLEEKFVPVANENAQEEIKAIYASEEKQVYLTFDDGPSKDVTNQILDILKENDVKATFFVLGTRVEQYPDVLKREYEEGHYIANHGYSHVYSQIYQSKDTVFQEYVDCENAIKKALDNEDYNSYLFRFPGGSSGGYYSSIKAEARELFSSYGVAYTNWNCLTGDAENNTTKEECLEEFYTTKGDQNSIILLMHDANDKNQTVEALPDIIKYFKDEGYTFKNFYEIFK